MFGMGSFWHQGNHHNFVPSLISMKIMGMKKKKSKKKGPKWRTRKKTEFFKILQMFLRKFHRLVLGLVGLTDAKGKPLTWLNLYGREAFRHKRQNSLKTPKTHFLPVFELMSDSPITIG